MNYSIPEKKLNNLELEFEINTNNVKSTDLYEGWAYDV